MLSVYFLGKEQEWAVLNEREKSKAVTDGSSFFFLFKCCCCKNRSKQNIIIFAGR